VGNRAAVLGVEGSRGPAAASIRNHGKGGGPSPEPQTRDLRLERDPPADHLLRADPRAKRRWHLAEFNRTALFAIQDRDEHAKEPHPVANNQGSATVEASSHFPARIFPLPLVDCLIRKSFAAIATSDAAITTRPNALDSWTR